MKIRNLFKKQPAKRNPLNHASWGRKAYLERLEDRRVLANYYVFDSGDSIQEQIDNADSNPGPDTIFILADDYFENITIQDNAPLTIIGLGNVNLFPDDEGNLISIFDSLDVTLNNLNVHDADDDNIDVEYTTYLTLENIQSNGSSDDGLDAENVDYVSIYNSRFNDNDDNGIELVDVGYAYLQDVQATSNGEEEAIEGSNNGLSYENGGESMNEPLVVSALTIGNGAPAGQLDIVGGDFSNNGNDGIYTNGVAIVNIDTIYGNNNLEDGVDVEDNNQAALQFSINYAATDANGDDGIETDAQDLSVTEVRSVHNGDEGLDIDEADNQAYIYNADFSFNGEEGLDLDDIGTLIIDFIQAIGNGINPNEDNSHGLNVDDVDTVSINNSQFISNIGDGIDLNLNEGGTATLTWVDSSDNTGNGIDLHHAAAALDGVNTSGNSENGIRATGLTSLTINNSSSTLNDLNGLLVEGDLEVCDECTTNGVSDPTDLNISWSEFSNNFEDGIQVNSVGDVLLELVTVTFNGDDGFDAVEETDSFTPIDSVFANNFDEDIVFFEV